MNRRFSSILAWTLWGLIVVCLSVGIYLSIGAGQLNPNIAITVLGFCGFATVGALIVAYRPGNTVGWLFLAIGIGTGFTASSGSYVLYGAVTGTHLPLAATLDWLGNVIWPVILYLGILVILLFPDGHLPSPRWRLLPWVLTVGVAAFCISAAFTPGVFSGETTINPYGISTLATPLNILSTVAGVLIIPCAALAVVVIVSRFWRSKGTQREQLKWVTYAAALMALCIAFGAVVFQSDIGFALSFCLLPLSAGIAILRSRLYDIDLIINRTLVYGLLTGLLAAVYFGSVIAMQRLASAVAGRQVEQNSLIIVLSTLLIAALFTPLRRRLQRFIDRRFYRSKYDTARTLERFAASLRSEVELGALSDHLVSVVNETMRPTHVSLWLRPIPREGAR